MKQSILIVYSKMIIGGSTTSLLSLLNSLDYEQYSVDLLLYDHTGQLQEQINPSIHLLPPMGEKISTIKKMCRPNFWVTALKSRVLSKKNRNSLIKGQYMSKYEALACPKLKKYYDVAISFLEFWPMEYVARRVCADKKIGWIHSDILTAGLIKGINDSTYQVFDKIVLVSQSCKNNMDAIYPEFSQKTVVIQNLLSEKTVKSMAQVSTEIKMEGFPLFVTVCRIDFASKGLDRAVAAFSILKEKGELPEQAKWYIIGGGGDEEKLREMIWQNNLESHIILLGSHSNPYSIEKDADFFLLPSRYEGKPMAITEAQMLGVIPVVCRYASADEQIKSGVDGLVVDNTDENIYQVLKEIFEGHYSIEAMKKYILFHDYSNMEEIEKFYRLIQN